MTVTPSINSISRMVSFLFFRSALLRLNFFVARSFALTALDCSLLLSGIFSRHGRKAT